MSVWRKMKVIVYPLQSIRLIKSPVAFSVCQTVRDHVTSLIYVFGFCWIHSKPIRRCKSVCVWLRVCVCAACACAHLDRLGHEAPVRVSDAVPGQVELAQPGVHQQHLGQMVRAHRPQLVVRQILPKQERQFQPQKGLPVRVHMDEIECR